MTSYRSFVQGFMLVTIIAGSPVCAQQITGFIMEIRQNNVDYTNVCILGPHTLFSKDNNCPTHKTAKGRSFEHNHLVVPNPLVGRRIIAGGRLGAVIPFTIDDVRDYWDNYFIGEAKKRKNVVSYASYGGEDLTYNCYGYAFGYDCWVQNAARIYDDGYEPTDCPSSSGVIRQDDHVITITSLNYGEYPHPVVGTSEKMRYSGIYRFLYEYSLGLDGDDYKDYYTPK